MSLHSIRPFVALLVLFICLAALPVQAQVDVRYTEGNVDQSLRSSQTVDPTTLGMSFSVTLANYPGRGISLPMTLNYSSKVWRVHYLTSWNSQLFDRGQNTAMFAQYSTAGWTLSFDVPRVEYDSFYRAYDGEGKPYCTTCEGDPPQLFYVERLTIYMPDGSGHEMRKSDSLLTSAPTLSGEYVATDGSRLKYNATTNTIYMPDGSRYLLGASGGVEFIDRNGNMIKHNATTNTWTDTLGRTLGFKLDYSGDTGGVKNQTITLPGVDGAASPNALSYTLVWKRLQNFNLTPHYPGNLSLPPYPQGQSPYLFTSTYPDCICSGSTHNPMLLAEIILPNSKKYIFSYNVYGEITKIELPTGGYYRYEYLPIPGLDPSVIYPGDDPVFDMYGQVNRGVRRQYVSPDGSTEQEWEYIVTATSTTYKVSTYAPDDTRTERYVHLGGDVGAYGFESARAGRVYDERVYTSTNQMLRRTLTEWTTSGPTSGGYSGATRDARITKQVEVILDTGTSNALTKTTTMSYDADLNVTATTAHDYYSVTQTTGQTGAITAIAAGTPLRTEEATFLVNDTNISQTARNDYRARHLIALPTETKVKNGSGAVAAATKYSYDEAGYPLLTYGSITSWTSPPSPATVRGNVTTTQQWVNFNGTSFQTYPSGSFVATHAQYDQAGNVRKMWDGNGKVTEVEFNDRFSDSVNRNTYAYPTKTISPVPDPTGTFGSTTAFTTETTYNFYTGKVTKTKDANSQEVINSYGTPANLNRLIQVMQPDGGITELSYSDTPGDIYIWKKVKQNATTWIEDKTHFDKLGRPERTAHKDTGSQWSLKQTEYDDLGRVKRASNPYLGASSTTLPGSSVRWTITTYDALGRVVAVSMPDVPTPEPTPPVGSVITTIYAGNQATVTDPKNKQRRSVTDALGRLSQVVEDPSGLNYQTNYTYDILGNLLIVEQGTQYRYFLYDSLSRLIRAKNPEQDANSSITLSNPWMANSQWSLKYTYDNNGNLTTKTTARNTTATYSYDALNRNTRIAYNDGYTPTDDHYYDPGISYGKGRLSYHVTYNAHPGGGYGYSRLVIDEYDPLGRVKKQRQGFLKQDASQWKDYEVQRVYNLAGQVTSQTYPSGRTVSYSYAEDGRLSSFSGSIGDGVSRTYADSFVYNAAGQMTRERFGTTAQLYHQQGYNDRLQMVETSLGTGTTGTPAWNRGKLRFFFSEQAHAGDDPYVNKTDNNGNVTRAEHWVPTVIDGGGNVTSYVVPQRDTFTYDGLNRIASMTEDQRNAAGSWTTGVTSQNYTYDRWGNRTAVIGFNAQSYTIQGTTSNRLQLSGGTVTYDLDGNQTNDGQPGSGSRTYDAESRMTYAVASGNNYYLYDADGKRVRRIVGAQEWWYVYGIDGELIAEYLALALPATTSKEYGYRSGQVLVIGGCDVARWIVTDHLGSPRIEVEVSGSLSAVRRHDYFPFGEENLQGVQRTTANGYQTDCVRQRFGAKELDNETGLHFFGERYYASAQGRFTSGDPLMASAKTGNPQSWNRFVYVLNNPLRYIDPDGMQAKDAWSQLTPEEQKLITAKLGLKEGESAQKVFNERFKGANAQETAAIVIAVKNFIDNAGGHSNSEVWQQVQTIDGGWVDNKNRSAAALSFSVKNSEEFLTVLRRNTYDVDKPYEIFNLTGDHRHSARFITDTSYQPGMHIVQQNSYPNTRFDVHWDPRSSAFRQWDKANYPNRPGIPGLTIPGMEIERAAAGLTHGNPLSAAQVRQELKKMGIAPRNEP